MPPHIRRFATLRPYLQQIDPAGGGATPPTTPPPDPPETTEPLGDAGKAALDRERADRKAAEKRARDAEQKLADIEAARVKAEEAEKVEQGKWEELAGKREAALQETTTERDSLKATNDALTAYFEAQYTTALKDLPDVIKAFAPSDDAPFAAKAEWLAKAKEQAAKVEPVRTPGNGPNPPPAGSTKPEIPRVVPPERMW